MGWFGVDFPIIFVRNYKFVWGIGFALSNKIELILFRADFISQHILIYLREVKK